MADLSLRLEESALKLEKADKLEAKTVDTTLKKEVTGDSIASTKVCDKLTGAVREDKCPSCGVTRAASEVATKLAYAARHAAKPPVNYFNKLNEVGGFGGSDAHCIVAQSQLRNFTRRFLQEFYTTQAHPSPCIFADDKLWRIFRDQYVHHAVKSFSEPIDPESVSNWLKKKHAEYDYWRADTEIRQLDLIGFREKAQKSLAAAVAPVDDKGIGTLAQRQTFGRFKQLFKSDPNVSWADGDPKMVANLDETETVTITGRVMSDTDDSSVSYHAVVDVEGKRTKYTKTMFMGLIEGRTEDLLTPTALVAKPPWVGRVFEGIMGSPFTQGIQCRYCEEVQGDGSLIQRMQYYNSLKDLERKANEDFVGKHLLALEYEFRGDSDVGKKGEIRKCTSAEGFVFLWMHDVAEALRERLREECKNNLNPKIVAASTPEHEAYKGNFIPLEGELADIGKAWVERRKVGAADDKVFSGEEMDHAISAVLRNLKPGAEYGEQAIKGQIRKLLVDPTKEKKIDNPALDLKVAAMLDDKFTKVERQKKSNEIEVKYKLK